MKQLFILVIAAFFALPLAAEAGLPEALDGRVQSADAEDLSQFLYKNRVLVIFADSPGDPRFQEQMDFLAERAEDLVERDVLVLIDTDPKADSPLRERFRPRGFMLVLIGKDGNVYLRKPRPWKVREISRSIDKMPIRREEMRNN